MAQPLGLHRLHERVTRMSTYSSQLITLGRPNGPNMGPCDCRCGNACWTPNFDISFAERHRSDTSVNNRRRTAAEAWTVAGRPQGAGRERKEQHLIPERVSRSDYTEERDPRQAIGALCRRAISLGSSMQSPPHRR